MRVLAVAGIARPERFFAAVHAQGLQVVRELAYPDHHWFSARDLDTIRRAAVETQAELVITTEKDAVRVGPQPGWAVLPMEAAIEPEPDFEAWLMNRLVEPLSALPRPRVSPS